MQTDNGSRSSGPDHGGSSTGQRGLRHPSTVGDVGCDLVVGGDDLVSFVDRLAGWVFGRRVWVLWPFARARPLPSFAARLPLQRGEWALVLPRSSAAKRGITVVSGVIDTGYTGPLYAIVQASGLLPVVVSEGQRLAQIVKIPAIYPETKEGATERGENGFGSTGR